MAEIFDENGNASQELLNAAEAMLESESSARGNEILRFFKFSHLPTEELRQASSQFGALALLIATEVPPSAERSAGLRKLLEAKDAIIRAML